MIQQKNHLAILFLIIFLSPTIFFGQSSFVLRGTVTDSASGEPLAAANIRVLGTSKGTITNAKGNYTLSLDSGTRTLVFSYLAYQSETLAVTIKELTVRDVKLKPSPIQMLEVVIIAEDPAIEIIRKAIANKRKWMEKLKSYKFEAFSRQLLRRDTAIASITESYSIGYMLVGDTLREVVKQKRQTENIPGAENFAAVHRIINFNEDEINLISVGVNNRSSSFSFIGPTAPNALEYYDYKLLNTSVVNGVEIYRIKMISKSRLRPLFNGFITIAEGTYAVMGVDVKPNETFTFPFIKDIDLRYRQQFALYNDIFWMPVDIRINGGLSLSIVGITMPRIGIEATSSIYDYEVNVEIPDSVLNKRSLTVDSTATKFDSTFWVQHEVLPLTTEEQKAYKNLDSSQTLEKQFQPSGPLATLSGSGPETFFKYVNARFNRVEGFFFGGQAETDFLKPVFKLNVEAGYGFSDQRFKYSLGATVFTTKSHSLGFGGVYYNKLDNIPDEGYYSPFTISLMALIDKNDYRDYFLTKGWQSFITFKQSRTFNATLSFINEKHFSMMNTTDYSLFAQEKLYRSNPSITEGILRSVRLDLQIGEPPVPLDLVSRDAFELTVEHSSSALLKSEFDFTRYYTNISYNITTFARALLFPPALKIKLCSGLGIGALPPQRIFFLDSRASGYAPFGVLKGSGVKEFSGDRFIMINLEHNFRSTPFLALNIPFLYRNSIDLIVHGSFAQTWNGSTSTSNGWYSEAGFGVSRIFDLLRADLTYRFKEPKLIYLTFSVASIF